MGMESKVTVLRQEDAEETRREFELDVLEGLSKANKSLPSVYFYDDIGSELYQRITEQEEYYLTGCEAEILEKNGAEMVESLFGGQSGPINVVELGAGDGRKTKTLLGKLRKAAVEFEYVPIDISRKAIEQVISQMGNEVPLHGIVGDYVAGLRWLQENSPGRRNFVLFLGSSIGNFDSAGSRKFLRRIFQYMRPGDNFLIGTDLKKDPKILVPAYSDSQGVTRDFNLNLLKRVNEQLGADFDPSRFCHMATYNPVVGAMESWLIAKDKQVVFIKSLSRSIELAPFESIHCEYSHKFTIKDVDDMGTEAGFVISGRYLDSRGFFLDSVWTVPSRASSL